MFNDVPTRVWLTIAIVAAAYGPAVYLYRHVIHDPSRRELFAPREDLSWRSTRQFVTSSAILAALAALLAFIFTPQAERFARSPSFLPLMLAVFGAFALFTVARSMVTGAIEPLVRGFTRTYQRSTQPRRFWASAIWNGVLGGMFFYGALASIFSVDRDRCRNNGNKLTPHEQISACSAVLEERDLSPQDRADIFFSRGFAQHTIGKEDKAIDDYNRAIELDPSDSYAFYNRGLLYLQGEQFQFAVEDFSNSLRLRTDNEAGYRNRADAYWALDKKAEAIADLTRVLSYAPNDEVALANRGILFAWSNDPSRAKRDFDQLRASYPSSIRLLRGEASASIHANDYLMADRKLREALAREPEHRWTLEVLAEVQDRLGRQDQAIALRRRLKALSDGQTR